MISWGCCVGVHRNIFGNLPRVPGQMVKFTTRGRVCPSWPGLNLTQDDSRAWVDCVSEFLWGTIPGLLDDYVMENRNPVDDLRDHQFRKPQYMHIYIYTYQSAYQKDYWGHVVSNYQLCWCSSRCQSFWPTWNVLDLWRRLSQQGGGSIRQSERLSPNPNVCIYIYRQIIYDIYNVYLHTYIHMYHKQAYIYIYI